MARELRRQRSPLIIWGVALQNDFNLTYAQLGLLPALYMVGLMVAAVIFNELTNHFNSFRLVGEHPYHKHLLSFERSRRNLTMKNLAVSQSPCRLLKSQTLETLGETAGLGTYNMCVV